MTNGCNNINMKNLEEFLFVVLYLENDMTQKRSSFMFVPSGSYMQLHLSSTV